MKTYKIQKRTLLKKTSEGNLERENMKSLSNSVTKFYDQKICKRFLFFPSPISLPDLAFPSSGRSKYVDNHLFK